MPGLGPGTPFRRAALAGGASIPLLAAGVDAALESAPSAASGCSVAGSNGVGAAGVEEEADLGRDGVGESTSS